MVELNRDVVIVGAGAAGLTAANELKKAGLSVAVLLAIWIAFYFVIFVPRGQIG